ncbi:kinase-like domain-containing protein [Phascolomyces articulosus]|uniref:Kinase-like domain-containing protein n=1 Tax=Phascolomyces articulosus TaxID=60185 RepID=A0AAD5KIP0_9FUNG|nr:kinase-like domain-containing protein [Phascolomyces articulosus]
MTYITRHSTTTHQQKKHHHHQQQQLQHEKQHSNNNNNNKRPTSLSAIRKRREIGDYILGRTIGRGASGRVKIGIHRHTGEQVAIKVISRSQLATSSTMARCVQRELAILQLLHHPHLVDLRQVLQDSSNVYFVMEYMEGGELFQVLSQRGKLPEDEARHLFRQLTTALAWCHAHHICHRDLKPENILLDKDQKHVKLADFGMATIQSPDVLLQTSCGSPHYASPEIVRGKHYYGPATDVWSCGVILYAMLTGHLPFDDDNVSRLLAKIKTGRYIPLPPNVSREAKDLIKSMLMVDPCKRITLDAVLAHPWLTNKSFLGSDLRFPDSLPLYPKAHDHPLHDQDVFIDLKRPVISDAMDLDGRIWETLKVLWRDCSQEDLLAALTTDGSNVPKLTCRLLQQRAWRQENGK